MFILRLLVAADAVVGWPHQWLRLHLCGRKVEWVILSHARCRFVCEVVDERHVILASLSIESIHEAPRTFVFKTAPETICVILLAWNWGGIQTYSLRYMSGVARSPRVRRFLACRLLTHGWKVRCLGLGEDHAFSEAPVLAHLGQLLMT